MGVCRCAAQSPTSASSEEEVGQGLGQTSPNVIKCIVEDAVTMNYREDMDADQLAAAIAQLEGRPSLASAQSDELEVHKNSPLQKMTFAII